LLLFSFSNFNYSQQYLVNSEWSATAGNDTSNYFYKNATVKTDANYNVYTLGSSLSNTGHDFLLMKQDRTGDTLFIVNWNGTGDGEDIAIDMVVDTATEYVYIVGGSIQDTTGADSLDPVLVVIDATGSVIYQTYYSGAGGYNDVYTSICLEGGYLYAGGTIGTATQGYDYLIASYDLTVTELYSNTYDYGLNDVSVKTTFDYITNRVILAGISESSATTWDYALVSYKAVLLNQEDESRNYAGSGQTHRPTDAVFINGFYYITGGYNNGINYDIKTVCLDTALTVVWEQTWNGIDSLNDLSHSIKVDNIGNVYVTGKTQKNNLSTDMVTIKYDNSGNILWTNYYDGDDGTKNDIAYDLELNGDNVYITGHITNNINSPRYNTICYDTAGNFRWQKTSEMGATYPTDMAIDGEGKVIIGAPLLIGFYTEKFDVINFPVEPVVDTSGVPIYKANEVVICFNIDQINTAFVDNKNKVFGNIEDVIDSGLVANMGTKLGVNLFNNRDVKVVKNFSMTTADSISVTRSGYEIKVPPFWATFLLKLPSAINELEAVDSLNTLSGIQYAEVNAAIELLGTNDSIYNAGLAQSSLHYTVTYPNGHINVDSVWNTYEIGKDWLKVGILDNGIYYTHQDFGNATAGSLSNSKIKGGKNYDTPSIPITNISPDTGYYYHGTAVAGIIGALRNNNKGIAGIAGGDVDDSTSTGVELYDMRVCCHTNVLNSFGYISAINSALYDGATSGPNTYNGLHIMNMSLGSPYQVFQITLKKALAFARQNEVVLVAARGKAGGGALDSVAYYPACEPTELLISVGSSGTNGWRLKPLNSNGNGGLNGFSPAGRGMDFLAPGAIQNITSLDDAGISSYVTFGGTSSASAHLTGVAALMMSNFKGKTDFPDNLNIEDIEGVLRYTAYDYQFDTSNVYSYQSGWGKINAKKALDVIQYPYYGILHFTIWGNQSNLVNPGTLMNPVVGPNQTTWGITANPTSYPTTWTGTAGGGNDIVKYQIKGTVNHSTFISPSTQILGYWVRNSYSDAWDDTYSQSTYSVYTSGWPKVTFDFFTPDSAGLTGYVYKAPALLWWFPYDPATYPIRLSYSIHVYDSIGQIGINGLVDEPSLNLYPNPAHDQVNVAINLPWEDEIILQVSDISGKLVCSVPSNKYPSGINIITIPTESLAEGMYILRVITPRYKASKKFIKH